MSLRIPSLLLIACLLAPGCDRNMEPYVPGETPKRPDLSRILPVGAEAAAASPMAGSAPPGAAPPMGRSGPPGAATSEATPQPIEGTISIAPALADRVPAGATLFLIARGSAAGPPTAVVRIESPSFPYVFSIGPEDRMIQTLPFVGPLQLTARLDVDGDAGTKLPGDLTGRIAEPVDPGAKSLTLTLDEIL